MEQRKTQPLAEGKPSCTKILILKMKITIHGPYEATYELTSTDGETWGQFTQRFIETKLLHPPVLLKLLTSIHPSNRMTNYRFRYGDGNATLIKVSWGEEGLNCNVDVIDNSNIGGDIMEANVTLKPQGSKSPLHEHDDDLAQLAISSSFTSGKLPKKIGLKLYIEKVALPQAEGALFPFPLTQLPFPIDDSKTSVLTIREHDQFAGVIDKYSIEKLEKHQQLVSVGGVSNRLATAMWSFLSLSPDERNIFYGNHLLLERMTELNTVRKKEKEEKKARNRFERLLADCETESEKDEETLSDASDADDEEQEAMLPDVTSSSTTTKLLATDESALVSPASTPTKNDTEERYSGEDGPEPPANDTTTPPKNKINHDGVNDSATKSNKFKKRKMSEVYEELNKTVAEPAEGCPEGWTTKTVPRLTGDRGDMYWYSPSKGFQFRSRKQVQKFVATMERVGGNEAVAMELFKVETKLEKVVKKMKFDNAVKRAGGNEAAAMELLKAESKLANTKKQKKHLSTPTSKESNKGGDTSDNREVELGEKNRRTAKRCEYEGCSSQARKGGYCLMHGGTVPLCKFEGCMKYARQGGQCSAHGAKRKRCETEGCTNQAKQGGQCYAHGAKRKQCETAGCTNQAIQGDICMRHGGTRKRCEVECCTKYARPGGLCHRHGGIVKCKLCDHEGCTKHAKQGGCCIAHGARVKRGGLNH